jgi:hypothetical protein
VGESFERFDEGDSTPDRKEGNRKKEGASWIHKTLDKTSGSRKGEG